VPDSPDVPPRDRAALERLIESGNAWRWALACPPEALRAFVEAFPDAVARADGYGRTLLHAAVAGTAHPDKVAYLLERCGIDPDARQADGTTPLYQAALAGNLAAVRLLLAHPVDAGNRNGDNRWTVLMVAAAYDRAEVAAELLARPDVDVEARDDRDATALHIAAQRGNDRVLARLARHPGIDLNARESLGRTALMLAAFGGRTRCVEELLAQPATDVNLVDRHRQSALHWAALGGRAEPVRVLLADPRTNAGITSLPDGRTARELAASAGHDEIAELIARHERTDPGTDEPSGGVPPQSGPAVPDDFLEPFIGEPPRSGDWPAP
jgi:ankyrin repeat protein